MSYEPFKNDSMILSLNNDGDVDEDTETEEINVIVHNVTEKKGSWTHVDDLDTFFTRMYHYFVKGGFIPMVVAGCLDLVQYCFVVYFLTFLIYCVNYPVLFREDKNDPRVIGRNVTFADIIYPNCTNNITTSWWMVLIILGLIGVAKLVRLIYNLYHAYDIKLFYNNALKINDEDITWLNWSFILNRVREAQTEFQICIQKQQLAELDIYQRILRFDNYFVAMINKRLLPLHINVPFCGEVPYLTKGLKYNLESILFYNHWSPWENCWHLRDVYKDHSKRTELAKSLENHIKLLALINLLLCPLIQAWQILYFFFNYAELIKRSPGTFGVRTWSIYSRLFLRHYNELDHQLTERLNKAYKPAMKYITRFSSPVMNTIAKYIAFLSGSVLGVLVVLSLYDEIVLTVEHMLTVITVLSCVVAIARESITENIIHESSAEDLLFEVQGDAHYLPADWKGKAHTKKVAVEFEKLFQYRAVYVLMELFSPLISPYMLYSMRTSALDIVDFYRNFSVSIPGIGDICSFSQMDIQKHGNPDWQPDSETKTNVQKNVSQYYQAEDGKTELSLIAFSQRNPMWQKQHASQQQFLDKLHSSVSRAASNIIHRSNPHHDKPMLSSYFNRRVTNSNPSLNHHYLSSFNYGMTIDEDNEYRNNVWQNEYTERYPEIIPDRVSSRNREEHNMSISIYHLYDLHNAEVERHQQRYNATSSNNNEPSTSGYNQPQLKPNSNEDTPLLKRFK